MAKTKTQIKVSVRIPRVIMDIRDADPLLLEKMEDGLDALNARIRVIGQGATELSHVFSLEEALENADIWVVFADHSPKDLKIITEQGIVPVMAYGLSEKINNYDAVAENGNAFLFSKHDTWHIYGSVVRALENFLFPYDWNNIKTSLRNLR